MTAEPSVPPRSVTAWCWDLAELLLSGCCFFHVCCCFCPNVYFWCYKIVYEGFVSQLCELNINTLACDKSGFLLGKCCFWLSDCWTAILHSFLLALSLFFLNQFLTQRRPSPLSNALPACHKVAAIQAHPWILNCYLNDSLYALCHACHAGIE